MKKIKTGPTLGSFLYGLSGFGLPFYSVGSFTTLLAFLLLFLVPRVDKKDAKDAPEEEVQKGEETALLRDPTEDSQARTLTFRKISKVKLCSKAF